jgi:GDPmannose 4,6-dehydratase
MKSALITGITGQDGSYLAELLVSKGYEVHGVVRPELPDAESDNAAIVRALPVHLHEGDLNDAREITRLVADIGPDEVYNLGAMSHVHVSFDRPEYTASTNAGGTVRLLDAIRLAGLDTRFYQASSSEMFALVDPPQSEATPFQPRSPYGISKASSHWCTVNYREAFGVFAVSGIQFNHESPRRAKNFLTRKVTSAVARIKAGLDDHVVLGSLDAVRDWGYAPEYVEGMWMMLQQDEPTDFVFATGTGTTVKEFVDAAFSHADLDWVEHVRSDPRYQRPAESYPLIGDASKAHRLLGWKAQTHAPDLARLMVDADVAALGAQ